MDALKVAFFDVAEPFRFSCLRAREKDFLPTAPDAPRAPDEGIRRGKGFGNGNFSGAFP
jgi:hypothetical protein